MKKTTVLLLTLASGASLLAGTPKEMRLEWSPTWKSGTVYEVEIDRGRLQKSAGINPNYGFKVFAEKENLL